MRTNAHFLNEYYNWYELVPPGTTYAATGTQEESHAPSQPANLGVRSALRSVRSLKDGNVGASWHLKPVTGQVGCLKTTISITAGALTQVLPLRPRFLQALVGAPADEDRKLGLFRDCVVGRDARCG